MNSNNKSGAMRMPATPPDRQTDAFLEVPAALKSANMTCQKLRKSGFSYLFLTRYPLARLEEMMWTVLPRTTESSSLFTALKKMAETHFFVISCYILYKYVQYMYCVLGHSTRKTKR